MPLAAERAARTDLAEHFSAGLSQGYAWSELEALCELSEDQLLALHGFGPRALGIMLEALIAAGMSLRY